MATSGTTSGLADQVGRLLSGRYRLVAPIGTGASATVHLSDDLNLERRVAVKVLHPGLAADEAFLRRFRAEARAAAALSHPNIMAVYDWGEDQVPYLVLELLSGGSLRSMLDAGHRLSLSQALVVGLDAARALEAAHRRGFVHRDIKPANLLFGDDGRLRVADFGLARALSEAAWTEPADGLIGTARYAAPEQAAGVRVDGKADVYSLALVLIEAVTGAVPMVADSALATIRMRADGAVPVPPSMGPLAPVLERALQPDPAARPDAATLVQELLDAARLLERPEPLPLAGIADTVPAEDDVTALPARPPADLTTHAATTAMPVVDDASPPRRRSKRWALLSILLVVLGVAGGVIAWQATRPATGEVPDVAGETVGDARAAIEAAEAASDDELAWTIEEEEQYSDGVAEGVVIRTDPAGGEDLAEDGTLTLVVSLGPEPVPVPNLYNFTEDEARQILGDAQLEPGEIVPVHDETVEAGRVVTWSAADAGDRPDELPKGSAVDLHVSQGPAPRTIPDVAGASPDEAQADLEELGLVVQRTEEFSDDVEAGLVIRSDPAAGTQAARGDTVTLVVSKGPDLVAVPDVVGMTYSEAYDTLEAAGFKLAEPEGTGNRVVKTDPAPGTKVKRGSTVTLYLRR